LTPLQRTVLLSIWWPVILVAAMFGVSVALMALNDAFPSNLLLGAATVLRFSSAAGLLLGSHVLLLFGAIGLAALSWRPLKHRLFTVASSAAAVAVSAPVLAALYFRVDILSRPWW
jgi:hypothetical protein